MKKDGEVGEDDIKRALTHLESAPTSRWEHVDEIPEAQRGRTARGLNEHPKGPGRAAPQSRRAQSSRRDRGRGGPRRADHRSLASLQGTFRGPVTGAILDRRWELYNAFLHNDIKPPAARCSWWPLAGPTLAYLSASRPTWWCSAPLSSSPRVAHPARHRRVRERCHRFAVRRLYPPFMVGFCDADVAGNGWSRADRRVHRHHGVQRRRWLFRRCLVRQTPDRPADQPRRSRGGFRGFGLIFSIAVAIPLFAIAFGARGGRR